MFPERTYEYRTSLFIYGIDDTIFTVDAPGSVSGHDDGFAAVFFFKGLFLMVDVGGSIKLMHGLHSGVVFFTWNHDEAIKYSEMIQRLMELLIILFS